MDAIIGMYLGSHFIKLSQEECQTNNRLKLYKLLPPTILRKYSEVVPNKPRDPIKYYSSVSGGLRETKAAI